MHHPRIDIAHVRIQFRVELKPEKNKLFAENSIKCWPKNMQINVSQFIWNNWILRYTKANKTYRKKMIIFRWIEIENKSNFRHENIFIIMENVIQISFCEMILQIYFRRRRYFVWMCGNSLCVFDRHCENIIENIALTIADKHCFSITDRILLHWITLLLISEWDLMDFIGITLFKLLKLVPSIVMTL